jgi:hypothetical protein
VEAGRQSPAIKAKTPAAESAGRLAGWLLARLGGTGRARPRLKLLERINLAPRQSLALVEAEGRRFLVATSSEGAPAFSPSTKAAPDRVESD